MLTEGIEERHTGLNGQTSSVRALVDLRDRTLQKARIAFGNRTWALERGADEGTSAGQELMERWEERFRALEEEANNDIAELVGHLPIVQELVELKGIGFTLAAKFVSMIDIQESDTVSALWRFAGYGVIDGRCERPTKGEKLHYNTRLKTTCYLIGTSFLRCNSPYRRVYDAAREEYASKVHTVECMNRSRISPNGCGIRAHPEWGAVGSPWRPGHQHAAAMRKMIKTFLAHTWVVWRTLDNLPTRDLYVMEYGGHTHYKPPQDYGWKVANGSE